MSKLVKSGKISKYVQNQKNHPYRSFSKGMPILVKFWNCPFWPNSEKNVHIGQIDQCIDMNNSYVIQISVPAHHESVDEGAR